MLTPSYNALVSTVHRPGPGEPGSEEGFLFNDLAELMSILVGRNSGSDLAN
jgi:hypothetical protein